MWGLTQVFGNAMSAASDLLENLAGDDDDDAADAEPQVPPQYVISDEMIEFIKTICIKHPHTFVAGLDIDDGTEGADNELSQEQLAHATRMLRACPPLERLRYRVCPKSSTERNFWRSYFWLLTNVFHGNATFVPPPSQQRRRRRRQQGEGLNVHEQYVNANVPPVIGKAPSDSESISSDWRVDEPPSPALSSNFIVVGPPVRSPTASDGGLP